MIELNQLDMERDLIPMLQQLQSPKEKDRSHAEAVLEVLEKDPRMSTLFSAFNPILSYSNSQGNLIDAF